MWTFQLQLVDATPKELRHNLESAGAVQEFPGKKVARVSLCRQKCINLSRVDYLIVHEVCHVFFSDLESILESALDHMGSSWIAEYKSRWSEGEEWATHKLALALGYTDPGVDFWLNDVTE